MTVLLQANDVSLSSRDGKRLVEQVSLTLNTGEVVGVIGPNGAGKSSLIKLLTGLRKPDSGTVLLDGVELGLHDPTQRARRIGYVEQRPHLYWPLTVMQVVALARLVHGDADTPAGHAILDEALHTVGIRYLAQRQFLQLSEGEKLLVNLARILAAQPGLIIADEPTAALDPARQLEVMQLLHQQARNGAGVLLVLHELTLAARYCDRLLLMQNARVFAEGTASEVLTRDNLRSVYQLDAQLDWPTRTVIIDTATG
ncbi:MAG TPA: ABC transporter ATP-binding protein [Candidatus Acidoferrum sp.]|nr:ABC transporter ATP-binding protein [Candidatus Acidoferrum sp.]